MCWVVVLRLLDVLLVVLLFCMRNYFSNCAGLSGLCSFMVPCMCGASGFMFVYFQLSDCFIMVLHMFMVVRIVFVVVLCGLCLVLHICC
jgi:hypothetical protein